MNLKSLVITIFVGVVLSACDDGGTTNIENSSQENQTQIIKELVHDFSVGNIKDQSASITSQQLIVTKSDGSKQEYDLSESDFFVSIAPYEYQTHP
jgi:hypothetical protein